MSERTQADTDWLRRRALKVPAPRYVFVSAPLVVVKGDGGLRQRIVAPKSGRTFVAGRNAAKRARRAQKWGTP